VVGATRFVAPGTLATLVEVSRERIDHVVERLGALKPVRILLFGSSARGDGDAFSDLDLIVVAEDVPARFLDRTALAYDLIERCFALDLLIYTPEEFAAMKQAQNPLIEAAEREGVVLYERSAG